jgi:hypothetical protein
LALQLRNTLELILSFVLENERKNSSATRFFIFRALRA